MANNNTEIEVQVNVENIKPLLRFLKRNAQFQSEKHQTDEYFTPYHRNFIIVRPVKEWFRLRNDNGIYSLTYKNWHYDNKGKSSNYCDEFETKIDDIKCFRKILSALDFNSIVKVEKLRKTWFYKDYEISVDYVSGLGDFVEIEFAGKNKRIIPQKIISEMINFLKKVGCGKLTGNNGGYPYLLLFPNEAKYEIY